MPKALSKDVLQEFNNSFESVPRYRLAMNAVSRSGIAAVALNRQKLPLLNHSFSHIIKTPKITDQKRSGRCWLFAGLNTLRLEAAKRMDTADFDDFELSQSYLMFWDKLEKANFFLENIMQTVEEPVESRLMMWLLADPLPDGGQWDMFVNLVEKYGVVPKTVMPETYSSSFSGPMNAILVAKLRESAKVLRAIHKKGARVEEMYQAKQAVLQEIYRILAIHLGLPPKRFVWQWRDTKGEFHRRVDITPLDFYREFVDFDLDQMVCLINAPTKDKPFGKMYTVQFLGNVVDAREVRYLNVDINTLKDAALMAVTGGEAVWFGSDVSHMMDRELGVFDVDIYDYKLVYDTGFRLDKAERLRYGHSKMNHAMVFTGVDVDDEGRPVKWRVENSWGDKYGDKGYFVMGDGWFDEYVYEVTVNKKYLPKGLLPVLETEPVVLPPWDPMGALAR